MLASKLPLKTIAAEARKESISPVNDNMAWKRWCRLCAKEDDESHLCVFPEINEPGKLVDSSLATTIGKFFWVNIRPNDGLSNYVCIECHTLVSSLTQFTERVNKVQAMFCALQNTDPDSTMNLNEVKLQYGLLDMEFNHIIKHERNITKEVSSEKQSSDEDEFELVDEDNKEEFFELRENRERKSGENFSVELVKRGIKRKRQDVEPDEDGDNDGHNIISFGALLGESEDDTEEHFIIENMGTEEEELDDEELLRQLRGDDDEEDETEQLQNSKREELEKTLKSKKTDEISENLNEQEEEIEQNVDSEDGVGGGEKSAQVNKIDSSSRVRKKRRGRQPKYEVSAERAKDEAESTDTNDNSQTSTSYKYECSICQKKYKNATSYRKHIMEKHNKEPDIPDFKCETCNKIYPTERQLQIHARSHLALEDKLDIPCPYCERKFTKVAVMRQHVQGFHENKKPFICDECGRSLRTLAALTEHKLVHTNDAPFECEVCQRAFKNKARLKVHLETHNDSSYICTECGLKLNTRRTLKMHMLVHSDAKRYKCDFCPAAFKRTKALKNHLILHTGMRPYKCNFCEKTFSNGSNCRSHKKKMHAQELAEEEAMGKKAEAVTVPKLEELRSSTNVVGNPRRVQRHQGGLPLHMRQLLIAAEERAKREQTTQQTNGTQSSAGAEMNEEETQAHSTASTSQHEDDDESEFIELNEDLLRDDDDDDDEDDKEMIVYEIIAEI
ncbi:zinc finger protein 62 homolog [Bactrocera tryoni]|uniref:zinc finger protein 62 homolog n=1 Tax=Bactrocera tryoni TaxID=59916 RepID=UPI001A95CEF2|nr:zinc finger protein 62 homolog [Bactrocera tryoni]